MKTIVEIPDHTLGTLRWLTHAKTDQDAILKAIEEYTQAAGPSVTQELTANGDKPSVDEEALARMIERGTKAWSSVPDAGKWVEEQRGNAVA